MTLTEFDVTELFARDPRSFFPSILERRRGIDGALFGVVIESYVKGINTRFGGGPPPLCQRRLWAGAGWVCRWRVDPTRFGK